jgi:hypothetical protein
MILTEDNKVIAWLGATTADPTAVNIILHRAGAGDNTQQTPPPKGEQAHLFKHYFDSLLEDAAEKSDEDNRPVRKKYKLLPRTDRGFRKREIKIQACIVHQQALLDSMKEHHLELIPDAMFSDKEEFVNDHMSAAARAAARAAAAAAAAAAGNDNDNDNDDDE